MDNYTKAFKKEMYRHILEDFSDSFTPGNATPKHGKKPVMIPVDYLRTRSAIVEATLAKSGYRKPPGWRSEQMIGQIFDESGDEMSMEANPSTPKIPHEMYDDLHFFEVFFKSDAFKANPIKNQPPEELYRQFKSSIMHVTQLYLRQRMKIAPEDFEFQSGATLDDMKKAVLNQYRRYFVSLVIMNLVQKVYEIQPSDIDEFLKITGFESKNYSQLRLNMNRRLFSKGITQIMQKMLKDQNLGKAILAQVRAQLFKE